MSGKSIGKSPRLLYGARSPLEHAHPPHDENVHLSPHLNKYYPRFVHVQHAQTTYNYTACEGVLVWLLAAVMRIGHTQLVVGGVLSASSFGIKNSPGADNALMFLLHHFP